MERKEFTILEASETTDIPEDELRTAIQDGLILARRRDNTGEFVIEYSELAMYVKRSRRMEMKGWIRKKKVLVLGEELLFAGTLKLELQRDPGMDVKFASWGKDAIMLVRHYGADLVVADLSPSKDVQDEVLSAVHELDRSKTRVLATAPQSREILKLQPLMEGRLVALAPDAFIAKSAGMRPMMLQLYELLGLPDKTQTIRRQA